MAPAGPSRASRGSFVRNRTDYDPSDLGLPKPPGFIRTFLRRNPWIIDALLMALYFYPSAISAIPQFFEADHSVPVVVTSLTLSFAVSAAILFRRFIPRVLAGVAIAAFVFPFVAELTPIVEPLGVVIALYALAVYDSVKWAWIGTFASWCAAAGAAMLVSRNNTPVNIVVVAVFFFMAYAMFFLLATLIGITVGNRSRYLEALLERAAQLAKERDQQARLATASERARIAREMHDIVAHSLTVMIALAEGANSAAARSPESAKGAMVHVAEIGRTSLADMRRVLGVLGDVTDDEDDPSSHDSALLAPQPTFEELRPLVDSYRAAGLPISLRVAGSPPQDSVIQLTIFRVVQEALTNALRYSLQPTRVEVAVEFGLSALADVSVTDDGIAPSVATTDMAASLGSGRGLIGMRERLSVLGGTVEADEISPHGWRVHAVIPHPSERTP